MPSPSSPPAQVALVSRAARGGHPRYCAEVAAALADQGAEVTIIEPEEAFAAHSGLLADKNVQNSPITAPNRGGWLRQEFGIAKALLRQRKTAGTVVFHDTSPIRIVLIGLLRAATSWTPVTMVHNTEPHLTSRRERLKHTAAMTALSIPHRVLVHNGRQRTELSDSRLVRSTHIDVVPHGTWTSSGALPSTAGIRDRNHLLCFGVMRTNSGLDELLDIAPVIDREHMYVKFKVVGSSTSDAVANQIAELAKFNTIEARDDFVSDNEAVAMFTWAGFVVVPYTNYSSESGVVMQAIAHGVPIITSPNTSVADRVAELKIGPDPAGSLLDQLLAGLEATDEEYASWQLNLDLARETFRWDEHARIILEG